MHPARPYSRRSGNRGKQFVHSLVTEGERGRERGREREIHVVIIVLLF